MDFGIDQFINRIHGYLRTEPWQVLIELVLIWIVVYAIVRFLRGTRGAGVIKGVAVLLLLGTVVLTVLGRGTGFERLTFLYSNFLTVMSLVLIIVFQPELRRALTRIGEARFFRAGRIRKARVVEELLGAIGYLSRNKIGALVAVERQVGLKGVIEAGTRIDGEITRELLNTIFWPGSALHDMGVVLRGDRVLSAGSQFPLAESGGLPQELGSRHRAGLGLSQESDALVLMVSEETGSISVAERGVLTRHLSVEDLRPILTKAMGKLTMVTGESDNDSGDAPATPTVTDKATAARKPTKPVRQQPTDIAA